MNIENSESKQPDDTRSPGVTDRDGIASPNPGIAAKKPDREVEVIRKLIVPDVTDIPAKSDDPRSPGVTDRDISTEDISANTTEETETIRKLIVPEEVESED
ncbi:hypothetical protein [Limnofasciculus baicalensis]|uniref:Uncharacterized protein n=1 Tax=Limnofasciculus baicalensis BBK-W-15 TaxID=2699891 RepID=A0AAE3GQH9_9CYAN|nr:hypothetical protein [Limnofasciculus baicalensis]MCP2728855.1 hypothetical protein [Limnofasciculus baicalensis BBK-W-15]